MRILKKKIIKYAEDRYDDPEVAGVVDFFKKNPLSLIPYDFTKNYDPAKIVVHTDRGNGMKYVMHENKRLYFRRDWDEKGIRGGYRNLLTEQDTASPHRYETAGFHVEQGDVVVDAGAAEGIFALSPVEKAKKLYLFEVDRQWIEALEATFAPWKDKVEIVCKYVSDNDGEGCITLDTFFGKEKVDFIKADIEGAETALLRGSRNILSRGGKLKVVVCAYHRADDAEQLESMLAGSGFRSEFSGGYMILPDRKLGAPYLRRGVIRGTKV